MQNTIRKNNITSSLNNVITLPKIFKKVAPEKTKQQDAKLIIEYLEGALIMNRQIEVEMNYAFDSETTKTFVGYLFQGKQDQLLLSQEYSSALVELDPKMIRSIHFVNKAA